VLKRAINLCLGKFVPLDETDEKVYAYIRDDPTIGQKLLVVLNMARGQGRGEDVTFKLPAGVDAAKAKLVITNGSAKEGSPLESPMKLSPFEGRIYLL
jgi:alpha-glucosidase